MERSKFALAFHYNVWFQNIFIPSPWEVIGNSKGEGGLKSLSLKGKYMYEAKLEFPGGLGGGG